MPSPLQFIPTPGYPFPAGLSPPPHSCPTWLVLPSMPRSNRPLSRAAQGKPLGRPQAWRGPQPQRPHRLFLLAALQAADHQVRVEHGLETARALRPAVAQGLRAAVGAPVPHGAQRARAQPPGAAVDAVDTDHAGPAGAPRPPAILPPALGPGRTGQPADGSPDSRSERRGPARPEPGPAPADAQSARRRRCLLCSGAGGGRRRGGEARAGGGDGAIWRRRAERGPAARRHRGGAWGGRGGEGGGCWWRGEALGTLGGCAGSPEVWDCGSELTLRGLELPPGSSGLAGGVMRGEVGTPPVAPFHPARRSPKQDTAAQDGGSRGIALASYNSPILKHAMYNSPAHVHTPRFTDIYPS